MGMREGIETVAAGAAAVLRSSAVKLAKRLRNCSSPPAGAVGLAASEIRRGAARSAAALELARAGDEPSTRVLAAASMPSARRIAGGTMGDLFPIYLRLRLSGRTRTTWPC